MGLKIISTVREGLKAKVLLEGNNFTDVTGMDAKRLAIEEGTKLLGLCGISNSTGPFPVDDEGTEIDDITKFAEISKLEKETSTLLHAYRNEFIINQSLGL